MSSPPRLRVVDSQASLVSRPDTASAGFDSPSRRRPLSPPASPCVNAQQFLGNSESALGRALAKISEAARFHDKERDDIVTMVCNYMLIMRLMLCVSVNW